MSKFKQKILEITYNKKKYSVVEVWYQGNAIPVVFDREDIERVSDLCIKLKCDNMCNITCNIHKKKINVANFICRADNITFINGLGLDMRKDNLEEGSLTKKILPKNVTSVPPYIWYIKGDSTHGDRFSIRLNDYKWTSTSSKKISTSTKLEQTKSQLAKLRKDNPELFEDTLINDIEIKRKKKLLNSFYNIICKAGFTNIRKLKLDANGNIISNYVLPTHEKKAIKELGKKSISKIPRDSGIIVTDLPKYVFYRKEYKNRGSHFVIENHPLIGKIWRTTTSKKVLDIEKYNEMINYYESLA